MNTPLFVYNKGDLLVFLTGESAERYLEPIDVQNGEYVGYDAQGRLLDISVFAGRTHIQMREPQVRDINTLISYIRDYVGYVRGDKVDIKGIGLEELVEIARNYPTA